MTALETFLTIFLSLNVLFLIGTAVWFRVDHATKPDRFQVMLQESLVEEVMWQYSLRSNLLIFGSVMAIYLIVKGELIFLLSVFAVISLLNVLTDCLYRYDGASIFPKVRKGHQIAAVVICSISVVYAILYSTQ
mmetsp:Transcript_9069/g.14534  ORF Transcript_9069/g.14534 Transcript_9069/m.14534 type:complete len:134 (+) Transcript_9069:92-493(+)